MEPPNFQEGVVLCFPVFFWRTTRKWAWTIWPLSIIHNALFALRTGASGGLFGGENFGVYLGWDVKTHKTTGLFFWRNICCICDYGLFFDVCEYFIGRFFLSFHCDTLRISLKVRSLWRRDLAYHRDFAMSTGKSVGWCLGWKKSTGKLCQGAKLLIFITLLRAKNPSWRHWSCKSSLHFFSSWLNSWRNFWIGILNLSLCLEPFFWGQCLIKGTLDCVL